MFLIIGHRGASGYEPENTLVSFKKAIELNADMIELDVYACRTGQLVVIHDYTVNRTTNGNGYVEDMAFEELRALDAGKGEKIPTLAESLDVIDRKCKVNIELKGEGTPVPVFILIEKYVNEKRWSWDDFYISSFNHYLLNEFISLMPEDNGIKICPLICGIPLGFAEFGEELNAYSINLSSEFINTYIIDDAHRRGMKVFVYTVNDVNDLLLVKKLGADGVFTNYPDRMRKIK